MRANAPSWCAGNIPPECLPPVEAVELLTRMLDFDPNTRITAEEAMQHPYFTAAEPWPSLNAFLLPAVGGGGNGWGGGGELRHFISLGEDAGMTAYRG